MTSEAWFAGGERIGIELGGERFEIFYRVGGAGPWLTALHGFPTSSWDWAKVVPELERRFRVLCFDFLGFGDSDKPRAHPYSIFEQADLTEALWRALGVEQTTVVAHDYGATVAQELLARPEPAARVTSVTLLNAAVYARLARPLLIQRLLADRRTGPIVARAVTERTFRRSLESVFSAAHPLGKAEIHEHWRVLERRGGSARLSHRLAHYLGERKQHGDRWETALEQANCPISFIWGMSDPRSGAHMAEEIRRRLPLAPLVELPDVGHYPQLEVPDAVASEIAAALDRELPAGRGFPAMVPEAPLVETGSGLVPAGEGWFVLNAREARWRHREGRGERLPFEGELEFPQVGVGLYVLAPGEPIGLYHWEAHQEDFLVLSGNALLIVEGEERSLRQWDFVHCPAETKHIVVGAGDAPCVVLAVGARGHDADAGWGGYTVDEAALRHGAGVEQETTDADEAYARFPDPEWTRYSEGWLPAD